MTTTSLDRRLRKLEAARSGGAAFFAAWGRTAEEARAALEHAKRIGAVYPGDEASSFVWPHSERMPPSRWITFSRATEADLSDREVETMRDQFEAELIRRERDTALAAGEDIAGLDETDFLIRSISCERGDASLSLRQLEMRQNPDLETHWPERLQSGNAIPCTCTRCQAGETTPMGAFHLQQQRLQEWRSRYLPAAEGRAS